jgi:hypothetical protein
MTINLHFNQQDWERIERDWTSWWQGELARPLVMIESSRRDRVPEEFTRKFLLGLPVERVLDYYQARLEATDFLGDAWPKWWPNFGAGIVAGFLGAELRCSPEHCTIWFEPTKIFDVGELALAYDADNIWWHRVRELTQAAVERWGDRVAVGHTDLGGNLDVLASLRTTEQLLIDLYDAPDEVIRLAAEINRLWLRYHDELYSIIQPRGRGTTPWAAIWSPGPCYMLQSDISYMLSPQMFERFVLPDIAACCEALDHAFYHLDGKGQIRHLDMLFSLESLHGIQWIPGDGQPPPEEWLPLLKRIREAGKLCQLYVTPQGAHSIVRELGGAGFAFFISQPMSPDEAEDFLGALAAEAARLP